MAQNADPTKAVRVKARTTKTIRICPALVEEVAFRAKAQGRSISALAEDIIRARLGAPADQVIRAEGDTLKRQLNRIECRLDKVIWEELQIKECLLLFVRVWLEHNPPLDDEIEDSAAASAEARFDRFLDLLSRDLTTRAPRDLGGVFTAAPALESGPRPEELSEPAFADVSSDDAKEASMAP